MASDDAIVRLFRTLEGVLGHDDAVTLCELLGWRATDALDRALRGWNDPA